MKKIAAAVAASALVVAVPAWAAKPPQATEPASHADHSHGNGADKGKRVGKCGARDEGYLARGTFVSGSLTASTGKTGRFDGTLTVDVTRANHKAPDGSQSFTLTGVRVVFGKGVTSTTLTAGDRVVLHGKISEKPRPCGDQTTPTITVHSVEILAPKATH